MVKVIACVIIGVTILFTLSCCKVAKIADEYMRDYND